MILNPSRAEMVATITAFSPNFTVGLSILTAKARSSSAAQLDAMAATAIKHTMEVATR